MFKVTNVHKISKSNPENHLRQFRYDSFFNVYFRYNLDEKPTDPYFHVPFLNRL